MSNKHKRQTKARDASGGNCSPQKSSPSSQRNEKSAWKLLAQDLVIDAPILLMYRGQLLAGKLETPNPTDDEYSIAIEGETNQRMRWCQQDLLKHALKEIKSTNSFKKGRRVCASYSDECNELYTGTIFAGPFIFADSEYYFTVKFDDGFKHYINISKLRLLPKDFPIYIKSSHPEKPEDVENAYTENRSESPKRSPESRNRDRRSISTENKTTTNSSFNSLSPGNSSKNVNTETTSNPDPDQAAYQHLSSGSPEIDSSFWKLRTADLNANARILVHKDGIISVGGLMPISPPNTYRIRFDGQRQTRARIWCQDELLSDALKEIKPSFNQDLKFGTRVCAPITSKNFEFHTGTIAGDSPTYHELSSNSSRTVEFDDGAVRSIKIEDIRLLPKDFPILEQNNSNASETLANKHNSKKRVQDSSNNKPHTLQKAGPHVDGGRSGSSGQVVTSAGDSSSQDATTEHHEASRQRNSKDIGLIDAKLIHRAEPADQLDNPSEYRKHSKHFSKSSSFDAVNNHKKMLKEPDISSPSCSKGSTQEDNPSTSAASGNQNPSVEISTSTNSRSESNSNVDSTSLENKHVNDSKVRIYSEKNPASSSSDPSTSQSQFLKIKSRRSSKLLSNIKKLEESSRVSSNDNGTKDTKEKSSDKQYFKIEAFKSSPILFHNLEWLWIGPVIRKQNENSYYNGIEHENQRIQIGDYAMFIPEGDDKPYIGQIQQLWSERQQNMKVKAKWFYHPEETKYLDKNVTNNMGALFTSDHINIVEVETILCICYVLPLNEYRNMTWNRSFCRRPFREPYTDENLFFIAGIYNVRLEKGVVYPGVL